MFPRNIFRSIFGTLRETCLSSCFTKLFKDAEILDFLPQKPIMTGSIPVSTSSQQLTMLNVPDSIQLVLQVLFLLKIASKMNESMLLINFISTIQFLRDALKSEKDLKSIMRHLRAFHEEQEVINVIIKMTKSRMSYSENNYRTNVLIYNRRATHCTLDDDTTFPIVFCVVYNRQALVFVEV